MEKAKELWNNNIKLALIFLVVPLAAVFTDGYTFKIAASVLWVSYLFFYQPSHILKWSK